MAQGLRGAPSQSQAVGRLRGGAGDPVAGGGGEPPTAWEPLGLERMTAETEGFFRTAHHGSQSPLAFDFMWGGTELEGIMRLL